MSFAHLADVLVEVDDLASRFSAAGKRLYLVGGIVRDLWLDRAIDGASDIDLTTDARPAEIKKLVSDWADAVWTQGERFGTIGFTRDGREFEVTTHRAEVYVPDSRKPEVAFGDDIETDLARRDFTVNAMAYEVPVGALIDPFGGVADLSAGRLRTPLSPEESFTDDPLRMIRAARFANTYGLDPATDLLDAATQLRDRLDIVAIERVRDELEKLFDADDVSTGLEVLATTGLLQKVFPKADEDSLALANAVGPPWWLRVAAVIAPHARSAAEIGAEAGRLRCSKETRSALQAVVASAHALGALGDDPVTDEFVRRWVVSSRGYTTEAWELARALFDLRSTPERAATFGEHWSALAAAEDVAATDVPLRGEDIAKLLGIEPGPLIGEALAVLRDHRFAVGAFDRVSAEAVVTAWWKAQ